MTQLVNALDVTKRDKMPSLSAWLMWKSKLGVAAGRYKVFYNGRTVNRNISVKMLIDHGRMVAQCPWCNAYEYVTPDEPILFCTSCGNNNSGAAIVVEFPSGEELAAIEAALLEREVEPGNGASIVEQMYRSKAKVAGLHRNWKPGQSAADLRDEAVQKAGEA